MGERPAHRGQLDRSSAATENSGARFQTGGQRYDIRMEFYENACNATARLLWSRVHPKAVVPTRGFLHAGCGRTAVDSHQFPDGVGAGSCWISC